MFAKLTRSIELDIRKGLSWEDAWKGPDEGLIFCWERGREKQFEEPDLAARASRGELIVLSWKGGIDKNIKADNLEGTLKYLATWQGLRNESLNIDLKNPIKITCSKFNKEVIFKR